GLVVGAPAPGGEVAVQIHVARRVLAPGADAVGVGGRQQEHAGGAGVRAPQAGGGQASAQGQHGLDAGGLVAVNTAEHEQGRPGGVAAKRLRALGENIDDLVEAMASHYAAGSPALAKFAARQAPVDLESEVPRPDLSEAPDLAAAALSARARALDLSVYVEYPQ